VLFSLSGILHCSRFFSMILFFLLVFFVSFSFRMSYRYKCAACGAGRRSKLWKSLKSGHNIPSEDKRFISFDFLSEDNSRICNTCFMENRKLLKASEERRDMNRHNVFFHFSCNFISLVIYF
jgi:hypothetical protein